jgi:hypothetical protein
MSGFLVNFIIYYTTPFRRAREQIESSFFVKNCQRADPRAVRRRV